MGKLISHQPYSLEEFCTTRQKMDPFVLEQCKKKTDWLQSSVLTKIELNEGGYWIATFIDYDSVNSNEMN